LLSCLVGAWLLQTPLRNLPAPSLVALQIFPPNYCLYAFLVLHLFLNLLISPNGLLVAAYQSLFIAENFWTSPARCNSDLANELPCLKTTFGIIDCQSSIVNLSSWRHQRLEFSPLSLSARRTHFPRSTASTGAIPVHILPLPINDHKRAFVPGRGRGNLHVPIHGLESV
jgi:hypothetical protein